MFMAHRLDRIAARLFNRPLLILPDAATALAGNLSTRILGEFPAPAASGVDRPLRRTPGAVVTVEVEDDDTAQRKLYEVCDGVAVIAVRGELINRGSWLESASGLTSYATIRAALQQACDDPQVSAIALDIDSPGGEATGCFEAATAIRAAAAKKPVTAYVDGMGCSAAYALASGSSELVVAPSATIGSIGVVWLHMDLSEAYAQRGVKPTLLHAGAYKIDGNEYEPLDDGARKRISAWIGEYYDLFVDAVGRHRPGLGADGARRTEAAIYVGKAAVEAKLADALGDFDGVLAGLRRQAAEAAASRAAVQRQTTRLGSKRSGKMAVKLHKAGERRADSLIEAGKVDRSSPWSFSAEDGDKLLGPAGDDWSGYSEFHLGEDAEKDKETKARWHYPHGKDGKVYRSALVAIRQRAAQENADDVYEAAGRLLDKVDAKAEDGDGEKSKASRQTGAAAERARIGAILRSEAAEGRLGAALVFALETDLTAEQAVKALAKTAKEAPSAARPASRLDAIVPRPAIAPDPAGSGVEGMSETEKGARAFAQALGKTPPRD